MSTHKITGGFAQVKVEDGLYRLYTQGQEVEIEDQDEVKRLTEAGVIDGAEASSDSLVSAFGEDDGGASEGEQRENTEGDKTGGLAPETLLVAPSDDEDIDALRGEELDQAVEDAGIDASKGGSLQDGSMSADEKRQALRDARAAD